MSGYELWLYFPIFTKYLSKILTLILPQCADNLLLGGAEVDLLDSNGDTALHLACTVGAMGSIVVLLESEASLSLRNHLGM